MRDPMSQSEHREIRGLLRTLGPILIAAGGLCIVIAFVEFFSKFGGMEPPRLFWLFFIGGPMLIAGLAMTSAGFAGKIARYYGREYGPAASTTFNEIARDSRPGMREIGGVIRETLTGEVSAPTALLCPGCGEPNDLDAKFCRSCGEAMPGEVACPACGHRSAGDARFCDECGTSLV
ncbi:MAG: zinc ribbon domain-containing protein [Phycisphaeraceae bacterium]|nr:MAG: zinc ribbon domain-containing protein [Phycisphaeraceae bacterium]